MLSERERRELGEIERFLAVDVRLVEAMRCTRLPRVQHRGSGRIVAVIVVALVATIVLAVLGSAVGAVICAATSVAVLGLSTALSGRHHSAGNGL